MSSSTPKRGSAQGYCKLYSLRMQKWHVQDWPRNVANCRADTDALAMLKWDGRLSHPILNTHRVLHRCIN